MFHYFKSIFHRIKEGKKQIYELGQYLRRRYHNLIGSKYSPNKVYIQSTDFDRTIMSAQVALAGLFPPNEDEKWNDELLWQPIPVHTIPMSIDHVLTFPNHFPKFSAVRERHLKESPEIKRILTEYEDHFSHWSRMSGSDIKTVENVYYLHNTLAIEKGRKKP